MDDDHWYGFRNALSQRGDEWSASRLYGTAITILNANCSLVNMTHTLWAGLWKKGEERDLELHKGCMVFALYWLLEGRCGYSAAYSNGRTTRYRQIKCWLPRQLIMTLFNLSHWSWL
jgi:hypothetical protein